VFTCGTCGNSFDVRQDVLDRYPGWVPKQCLDCKNDRSSSQASEGSAAKPSATKPSATKPSATKASATKSSVTKSRDLTTAEVLARYTDGPRTGIFTDGATEGNPGPGGWGAAHVVDGEILDEAHGSESHTTNNKMELTAMIAGLKMLPLDSSTPVFTDSQLVVNIITTWAEGWKAKGWRKKSSGPIANLELVKEAYELSRQRPDVPIRWIKAHSGNLWNEYADALATAYRRSEF
jgi:ribonuclease HI